MPESPYCAGYATTANPPVIFPLTTYLLAPPLASAPCLSSMRKYAPRQIGSEATRKWGSPLFSDRTPGFVGIELGHCFRELNGVLAEVLLVHDPALVDD